MKKSILDFESSLKEKLLEVPKIVDLLSKKEFSALDGYLLWLQNIENLLKNNNSTLCSDIAGIRASILSKKIFPKDRDQRREQFQVALNSISYVIDKLYPLHNLMETQLEEVRLFIKQILPQLHDAGLITFNDSMDFTSFLENLIAQLKAHPQLASGVNKFLATVGKNDLLRIFASEIEFFN